MELPCEICTVKMPPKGELVEVALRIELGLMGSKPDKCLGVLSGIPPLAERFTYLNFRLLIAAFCLL
jgi:hypothetical protein